MFPHRIRLPVVNLAVPASLEETVPLSRPELLARESGRAAVKTEWSWKVLSGGSEIEGLARDWRRLVGPQEGPFQTYAWIRAWYRHFADVYEEPVVFVVSRGGRAAAIFPCYRKGNEIRMAGDLTCDYQDVIAADEESVRVGLGLFISWVRRHRRGCDLFFEKLSTRGRLHPVLKTLEMPRAGVYGFRKNYGPCPWVALPESLDAWLASLPRKSRGDWRRALNRLDRELPESEIVVLRGDGIPRRAVREAAEFHQRHFRMGGSSPLADPRLVALLEEVASQDEVGLRLSRLQAGRIPLAIDFGFTRGKTYYGYLAGFDETFAKLAPGKCLLLRRIDWWLQEDGVRVLDFLCGGERYKDGFTSGSCYHVCSVRLLPRSVPNTVRFLGLWTSWLVRGGLRRVTRHLGIGRADSPGRGGTDPADPPQPAPDRAEPDRESTTPEPTRRR